MASRRIYITLNDEKEKDRIIESYLSQSYSESDAIKEALYRLATNSTLSVQSKPKRNSKGKKDSNSSNKVEKVANSNKQELKDINSPASMQLSPVSDNTGTVAPNNTLRTETDDILLNLDDISDEIVKTVQNDNAIRQNELEELKGFM